MYQEQSIYLQILVLLVPQLTLLCSDAHCFSFGFSISPLFSNCPASVAEGVRVRQRLPTTCYCIRSPRSNNSVATIAALTVSYLPSPFHTPFPQTHLHTYYL